MSDDFIVQRLIEIYHQKILIKQELSEEEIAFISDNIEQMKATGKINEQLYAAYLLGFIVNPSIDMKSDEIADGIRELKELKIFNQVLDYGDGSKYTEYERILYQLLGNSEFALNDNDKAKLVNELENKYFTHACLHREDISGKCKMTLLQILEEQGYATRDEYFQILYGLAKREKSGIEPYSLVQKIINARYYKLEEVTEEQDDAYDSLLYLSARDMREIEKKQKIEILASSPDLFFIRNLVESDYLKFGLTNDERISLIAKAGNQQYIEDILRGKIEIDLGDKGLRNLVCQNAMLQKDKKEYLSKYIHGDGYNFTLEDRKVFIVFSNDKEAAKELLESKALGLISQVELLGCIGDREYSSSFIERQEEPLRMYLRDKYIRGLRNRGRKKGLE